MKHQLISRETYTQTAPAPQNDDDFGFAAELMPPGGVIDWYFANCTSDNRRTIEGKERDFSFLLEFLGNRLNVAPAKVKASDVLRIHIQEFVSWRIAEGDKASTLNRRLANVKHLFKCYAAETGSKNPAHAVKFLRFKKEVYRGIENDTQRIRAVEVAFSTGNSYFLRYRNGCIVELLFATGLRRDDLWRLNVGQLSADLKVIRGIWSKGNSYRKAYIPEHCRANLRAFLHYREQALTLCLPGYRTFTTEQKGKVALFPKLSRPGGDVESMRLGYFGIFDVIQKIAERSGFRLNFRMGRHTFAHKVLDSSKDVRFVSQALDHSDVKTTMHYTERTDEEYGAKIEEAFEE